MILTIRDHQILAEALHQLSSVPKSEFASSELQEWTTGEINSVIDELNEKFGDHYRELLRHQELLFAMSQREID